LGLLVSVVLFTRQLIEITSETILSVCYQLRHTGSGIPQIPMTGPCLLIGNHGCWFDPLFLAKMMPRPVQPIMTQQFYDYWFLKPLLKYVFRVIVVPEKPVRHEAPELDQAVAMLDRGECVMIFPEGYLQRKPEQPLRRFGQGIWHILKARPQTPVVACWVENGWGSYVSYYNGPPTKNKPFDWFRIVRVGVAKAVVLDTALLEDGHATRFELMRLVANARTELGLPAIVVEPPSGTSTTTPVLPQQPEETT
jgi:1-acyl-sn-glycerol-3-phosphate acyltransferase